QRPRGHDRGQQVRLLVPVAFVQAANPPEQAAAGAVNSAQGPPYFRVVAVQAELRVRVRVMIRRVQRVLDGGEHGAPVDADGQDHAGVWFSDAPVRVEGVEG